MRILINAMCAVVLVASSTMSANATIITIRASGQIGDGPQFAASGGAFFGLTTPVFIGSTADFVWTIDTDQLGTSSNTYGANTASWIFNIPQLAVLDPVTTSATSIGIDGEATVNGITLQAGLDRQTLSLQMSPNIPVLQIRSNTWSGNGLDRDWVNLDILDNAGGMFLTSLNPQDLVGNSLGALCGSGGTATATLRRFEGATQSPPNTHGAIDLCAQGSSFSITSEEVPAPTSIAIMLTALLAMFGLGAMRRHTARN